MTKNLSLFVLALLVSAFLIWEYKVNLIVWALPKVMNVVNPIQENIPTTWSMGPEEAGDRDDCLLYTSPSPRDVEESRMPSSA